ncbi:MAG: hypothetical protein AVDCRST_MAG61-558 [uncultured Friedmanniella sp.]|uniref:histidine kinase n=1 Tax=uncultured Friedmanniella sp. TaxID=335381 RepID=A0A6J4K4V9_9ACTN|nr:sensor histidine kinase [uncultured Friedmanniella sp.]CAA9295631.1 MAG: hypothetical protein AVDCRST_MAG61-558 [uncultured Friedmanniella sp.]
MALPRLVTRDASAAGRSRWGGPNAQTQSATAAARQGLVALLAARRDSVLATLAALVIGVETLRWADANRPLCLGAAVLAGLGLSLRRSHPVEAFLISAAGLAGVQVGARGMENDSVGFLLVYVLALYSLGRYAGRWRAWLGAGCVVSAMVVFYVGDFVAQDAPLRLSPGNVAFAFIFVGGPWGAGLAMRLRRQREASLRARNDSLVRQQEQQAEEARQAIIAERARIARELHDVVSHAISVSVLQARGARRMLGRDADAVSRALDAIEHTNAQALGDMRRLLALLREADEPEQHAPQPSLARLKELAQQVEAAGVPVRLEVTGAGAAPPPGVELSAFRIVQEALTNVLRHAGPGARATVEVRYAPDHLDLAVVDTGRGSGSARPSTGGHGLIGIRERVFVAGGRVAAGPEPQGGFAVRARLPYAVEVS